MDELMRFLGAQTGDPRSAAWAFIALVTVTTFVVGSGAALLFSNLLDPVRLRARAMLQADREVGASVWSGVGAAMAPYLLPKAQAVRERARLRLMHAGYRSEAALHNYYVAKAVCLMGLPLLVVAGLELGHLPGRQVVIGAAWSGLVGLMLPERWLKWAIDRRRRLLTIGMPDALDLLVVCTEAGHGLKQAIQRVSEELQETHPELAAELALVNAEMRAGVDRVEALRHLAERTGLEDISGLVSLMAQSLRFGTSIADSLRVYADEFRDKRTQRAEETAATIATRMVFPLVTCMFPAFFLVAIGPAVVGVVGAFSNM